MKSINKAWVVMALQQHWRLDNLFAGGSQSTSFRTFLEQLEASLKELVVHSQNPLALITTIDLWQECHAKLREADSFVSCLCAQNVKDSAAASLRSHLSELSALIANASNQLDKLLVQQSDDAFKKLLASPSLSLVRYPLEQRRKLAREKLDLAREALVNDLSVDGYHGWQQLYSTLIGRITIPFEGQQLSWGQAENKMCDPDRSIRKAVFESSQRVWQDNKEVFAQVLNHIAGFRLKLYEHRGWDSVLKEPLENNHMTQATLDAMWSVVEASRESFVDYLKARAKWMGLEKLSWYDLTAPLPDTGEGGLALDYDKGAAFIVKHFHTFSPKMAALADRAFKEGWIEAEDRPGKAPGGFCTSFPLNQQTRIFMTYANTKDSLTTLAHELGHAFHSDVVDSLPELARLYPMNLAETASTLAELLISDAALASEKDPAQHRTFLDAKVLRSSVFMLNLYARFLFETRFFEERSKGIVSADRLCQLMEDTQREVYGDALDACHPFFWLSKMHFYLTDWPFYNFPYTFGFLFSLGIYAEAKKTSKFEDKWIALLADTGRKSVEEIAKVHLGVDLTKPDFWQHAVDLAKAEIKTLLETPYVHR